MESTAVLLKQTKQFDILKYAFLRQEIKQSLESKNPQRWFDKMPWRIIQTPKGWNKVKWCASLGFVQPRTRNTPRLRDSLFVSRGFCICIQGIHYLYSNYSLFVSGEFFLCVQRAHYLYPGYSLLYSPHMLTDDTTFV